MWHLSFFYTFKYFLFLKRTWSYEKTLLWFWSLFSLAVLVVGVHDCSMHMIYKSICWISESKFILDAFLVTVTWRCAPVWSWSHMCIVQCACLYANFPKALWLLATSVTATKSTKCDSITGISLQSSDNPYVIHTHTQRLAFRIHSLESTTEENKNSMTLFTKTFHRVSIEFDVWFEFNDSHYLRFQLNLWHSTVLFFCSDVDWGKKLNKPLQVHHFIVFHV